MITKKISLFSILFLLLTTQVWATDFVVTSNADSGPGTLREALTLAAADTLQADNIFFNLPDVTIAGRTITLLTELPEVSSNLTIDASTQPGAKLGVSDARVQLLFQPQLTRSLSGLKVINRVNVALYGLYLFLPADVSQLWMYKFIGIELMNCRNVQLGAPGKGNVLCNFRDDLAVNEYGANGSSAQYSSENLTLKSNFFGIRADGVTLGTNLTPFVHLNYTVGQILIGGPAESEGNLFARGLMITQTNHEDSTDPKKYYLSTAAVITIRNNKLGINYAGTANVPNSVGLLIGAHFSNSKNTVFIEDNTLTSTNLSALSITGIGRKVTILRNYIGTDRTRQKSFPGTGYGMSFSGTNEISVGSNDPADANYMTNCDRINIIYGVNVTINKNSFYCLRTNEPMHSISNGSPDIYPKVNITAASANSITGTSTPNAVIELFYSDNCNSCAPQTYFASTTADAAGNWRYDGPVSGTVIASATGGNNTSDFSTTTIEATNVTIVEACNGTGGAIKGAIVSGASSIKWVDANNNIVGTSADLENVTAGKYKLIANGCKPVNKEFEIPNALNIDASRLKKTDATCGNNRGNISGIAVNAKPGRTFTTKWTNSRGNIVGSTLDLNDMPPENYFLTVTANDGCVTNYGPVTIALVNGPVINQSSVLINSSNCSQSTGSISRISAIGNGALKYSWRNEAQQEVGTSAELNNVPTGRYTLQVTDASTCPPASSTAFFVPEQNGINIDETNKLVLPASCANPNGSIKGLVVTGAIQYKWVNAVNTGAILSTTAELLDVPPGDYVFTASNTSSCFQTRTYTIGVATAMPYPLYLHSIHNACYGQTNGAIYFTLNNLVKSQRWLNSRNVEMGTSATITNLPPDTYRLLLKDAGGCETVYGSYTISETLPLQVEPNSATLNNDACNTKSGSIKGLKMTGGTAPYKYTWRNAGNDIVSTFIDAEGLGAGTYTLTVTDARSCERTFLPYLLTNVDNAIGPPVANNVSVCSPSNVSLSVQNPSARYRYRLYDSPSATAPVQEHVSGTFTVKIKTAGSYYVSQVAGTCESARVEVKFSVGLSAFSIANAFTPNGDGVNDFWRINGIENSPTAIVSIFNRSGQKLFESVGYKNPFDGTYKGKALPSGTYYYIINMGGTCSMLSGSLTIIR